MSSGSSQLDPPEDDDEGRIESAEQLTETNNVALNQQAGRGSPNMTLRRSDTQSTSSDDPVANRPSARRGRPLGSRSVRGRAGIERPRPYTRRRGGRNRTTANIVPDIVANQLLFNLNIMGTVHATNPREMVINFRIRAPEGSSFLPPFHTDSENAVIRDPDNTIDNNTGGGTNQEVDPSTDRNET